MIGKEMREETSNKNYKVIILGTVHLSKHAPITTYTIKRYYLCIFSLIVQSLIHINFKTKRTVIMEGFTDILKYKDSYYKLSLTNGVVMVIIHPKKKQRRRKKNYSTRFLIE